MSDSVTPVLFPFEDVELHSLPLAARRALDHAGQRLSLSGWRSLSMEDRRRIASAGASDPVDTKTVLAALRNANPAPQPMEAVGDPDAQMLPEALVGALGPSRPIEPGEWRTVRSLDRYALAYEQRRSAARRDRARLFSAFDAIFPRRAPSSAPPRTSAQLPAVRKATETMSASRPGRYSEAPREIEVTASPSVIPPAPPLPQGEGMRASAQSTPPRGSSASQVPIAPAESASTHTNSDGEVHIVDVGAKPSTVRRAVAFGSIRMRTETAARVLRADLPKGEVIATARIAGIMAAKRTPELIPLCHSVALTSIQVEIHVDAHAGLAEVSATAEAYDRTGVEMEALTAVTVTCLTMYDMLKGIDREMVVGDIKLMEKSGGRTGSFRRERRR